VRSGEVDAMGKLDGTATVHCEGSGLILICPLFQAQHVQCQACGTVIFLTTPQFIQAKTPSHLVPLRRLKSVLSLLANRIKRNNVLLFEDGQEKG
jgi:hypothetical protein